MNLDPNATTVIIALTTLLGVAVAANIYVLKWAIRNYGNDIKNHTNAANSLAEASATLAKSNSKMAGAVDRNTQSNNEVLKFMKNLNGKLAQATVQTIKEQNVEHQHVGGIEVAK